MVGLAAGLVRWGYQDMLATLTACTWFASPALAFGLSALMYFVMEDTEVKQLPPFQAVTHLQLREAKLLD